MIAMTFAMIRSSHLLSWVAAPRAASHPCYERRRLDPTLSAEISSKNSRPLLGPRAHGGDQGRGDAADQEQVADAHQHSRPGDWMNSLSQIRRWWPASQAAWPTASPERDDSSVTRDPACT